MIRSCDTCGDSYKMTQRGKDTAREEAKRKANETKEPFAVCEEAGEYFSAPAKIAIEQRYNIKEFVSGL